MIKELSQHIQQSINFKSIARRVLCIEVLNGNHAAYNIPPGISCSMISKNHTLVEKISANDKLIVDMFETETSISISANSKHIMCEAISSLSDEIIRFENTALFNLTEFASRNKVIPISESGITKADILPELKHRGFPLKGF